VCYLHPHLGTCHRNRYSPAYAGTVNAITYNLNAGIPATYLFSFNYSSKTGSSYSLSLAISAIIQYYTN
jgi:hypothetical protein